ncbi:hypothetical protein ASPFODRAFT_54362 [Aspergillus luchuensis CBS 106.47]|uniref:Uncharacterized protein n=1 Tax=Aspergillus luchuensis (strain CBS 106.47) TaxID=1137211 RepID=A0A1M3SZE4_ASPLC|nr:hypothetical protein ASPFODRAFT_54362 [Aspergillus luchuensis CBS 106.47]
MHPPRFRPGTYSGSSPNIGQWKSYCTASSPPLLERHAHVLSWDLCIPVRASSSVVVRRNLPLNSECRHLPDVGRYSKLIEFEDDNFRGTSESESPHCLLLGSVVGREAGSVFPFRVSTSTTVPIPRLVIF